MKRFLILCALTLAVGAYAGDLPVRVPVAITNTSPASLTLPAFGGNGQLVAVQVFDQSLTNNTLTVRQIIPVTASRSVTNVVATLTYTTTFGMSTNLPAPPYVCDGDTLTGTFGSSSTGTVFFTRTIAK